MKVILQYNVLHKEYKPSGSPLAEFYVGPNNRVVSQKMFGYSGRSIPGHDPSMKTTGGLMFYHFDGMSSVSELTDRHGDVIQHYRHDAFGGLFTGITAPYNTNSHTGHQYDQDVGLIDMRARWYDASIGRFLQEDTYPGTLDNPLSQNRYAYVMNNPMNFWDPTGRVPEEVTNRENFRVTVGFDEGRFPDYRESWKYEFLSYSYEKETIDYNDSLEKRQRVITWIEVVNEIWNYRAILEVKFDREGVGHEVFDISENHTYRSESETEYELIVSAESMMEMNYEELIRHGWLPRDRRVLFTSTETFKNRESLSREILIDGVLNLRELVELVGVKEKQQTNDLNLKPLYINQPINLYGEDFISKGMIDIFPVRGLTTQGVRLLSPDTGGRFGSAVNKIIDRFNKGKVNPLPNLNNATIDSRKLTEYALNPNHPVGKNKARVFERALGYNQSNANDLLRQIQNNLPNSNAVLGRADQYGQRYTVDMLITGPNGNTATVTTGWIIKPGSNTPELTTLFVK